MNQQKKLWRYIDLSKFIDLLNRKELFFTRLDKFDDPFEGASTQKDYLDREEFFKNSELYSDNKENKYALFLEHNNEQIRYYVLNSLNDVQESFKVKRKLYFANCWHLNEFESEAMWKLYLQSGEGIAIQTSVERLERSLKDVPTKYMREVKYIDYQNERFEGEDDQAAVYFFKRNHFEHEKEYRVIIPHVFSKDDGGQYKIVDEDEQNKHFGIHIPVTDLSTLIENVYISPTAPEWFTDVVTAVIERFNLTNEKGELQRPIKSSLKQIPFY
ncbi:DUF2971 domain-containing protein [Priestia megaterium]|uniref:DUF2971 domain-containing protein n=1 Tax=Priestia megaterium TaxID=1404 RepID=UPI002FFDDBC9